MAQEEVVPLGAEVTVVGLMVTRDGERVVAAGAPDAPFSIAASAPEIAQALRRMTRRLRIAAVLVPVAGAAMVGGGFWWVLAD